MGSFGGFLLVYVFGGVTFIPLVLGLILLHAYLTLPPTSEQPRSDEADHADNLQRETDDQFSLKTGTDVLAEKFQRAHESDVAAGYFAVCREYVPGGVNGKPPERTTPAGDVVSAESPSVYQSMYRSIFDRKPTPTIDPGKGTGKGTKKARNVFFVILRHGHLMLYDDAEQIEVRYVISLAHHDVTIYGGGEPIPEGELWIKRNAIRLTRKPESIPDTLDSRSSTLPFYLFSENLSEKEDFYFAILKNLEKIPDSLDSPPTPQHYDVKHIISLVQHLHSSEEHLQTRWINALMGRLFLAMYKTPELEAFIRKKITKKISRVKKPNFITKISLQKIDAGEGAPLITNPRLRDLTVDGDCCVEADITYSGNFRLEVAATARIELGTRFKPREVDLVLAVVLKKLSGHGLMRFKPPPSNRLWISFETMPTMEMAIEPIVSSRQITYGVILRAIESRIREVIAETLVQPFWDDIPFLDTESETYRGGIWHRSPQPSPKTLIPDETGEQEPNQPSPDPTEALSSKSDAALIAIPTGAEPTTPALTSRAGSKSIPAHLGDVGFTSGVEKINRVDPPRAIRSQTFSHVADPIVTPDTVNIDHSVWDLKPQDKDAAAAMIAISNRSQPNSPSGTPIGSPPKEVSLLHRRSMRSDSLPSEEPREFDVRPRTPSIATGFSASAPSVSSSRRSSNLSLGTETAKQDKTSDSPKAADISRPKGAERPVIGSIGSAAAAARKWSLNVLGRVGEQSGKDHSKTTMPDHPVGRGRPLPPPGTPLPPPDRFTFMSNAISMQKRKPLPPPLLPERQIKETASRQPPKSEISNRSSEPAVGSQENITDELLVIEAPMDSEPTTPITPNTTDKAAVEDSGGNAASRKNSDHGSTPDAIAPDNNSHEIPGSPDDIQSPPPTLPRRQFTIGEVDSESSATQTIAQASIEA
ncbi:hypothetical protein FQN52_004256 [Onygenales sp. PD_12]|nr:hypothetical protein FQN52_004256 [Onygenales sp. PD_12]KAK2783003.1 hypothetical protein FQN53_009416 [Emmonsiellopsis sp. PD_33]